jgi:carbon monoxide dehydrogenase subunit G
MSSHIHRVEVNAPIQHVWNFVRSIDRWAPLVPGYIEHEILNDRESMWKFKNEVGMMKKTLHLKVVITNWIEPNKVTFDLKSMNEKLHGNGYFEAIKLTDNKTSMAGFIELIGSGTWTKMVNPLLKTNLPIMIEELTNSVGHEIESLVENDISRINRH